MTENLDNSYVQTASRIELQQLRYFVTVAECLNFSKAAEKLFVTQPLLSQQISALEQTLGTKLFLRSTKSVQLTASGRTLLEQAEKILSKMERLLQDAQEAGKSGKAPPRLRTACDKLFDRKLLSDLMFRYHMQNPEVDLTLRRLPYPTVISELQREELDIGFAVFPAVSPLLPGLQRIILLEEGLGIVVSREVARDREIPLIMKQEQPDLLITECDSRMLNIYERIRAEIGLRSHIRFYQTIEDLLLNLKLGEGAAILPESLLKHFGTEGFRVFPCGEDPGLRLQHGAYYRTGTTDPNVLDWIAELSEGAGVRS